MVALILNKCFENADSRLTATSYARLYSVQAASLARGAASSLASLSGSMCSSIVKGRLERPKRVLEILLLIMSCHTSNQFESENHDLVTPQEELRNLRKSLEDSFWTLQPLPP